MIARLEKSFYGAEELAQLMSDPRGVFGRRMLWQVLGLGNNPYVFPAQGEIFIVSFSNHDNLLGTTQYQLSAESNFTNFRGIRGRYLLCYKANSDMENIGNNYLATSIRRED